MNLRKLLDRFKKPAAEPSPAGDICDTAYELSEVRRDDDSDPFLHSLKVLTPDDIAPPAPKKKYTAQELIIEGARRLIIAVCAVIFVGSAIRLAQSFIDYRRGDDLYGSIAQDIFNTTLGGGDHAVQLSQRSRPISALPDYYTNLTSDAEDLLDELGDNSYNVRFEQMKSNLTYLKGINPDIFGYIYIDGTRISFPVVQYTDNEYYLEHAYTGEYMVCGSIFADFRAYRDMEMNRNTVFYGHNMKDGNMFNNVMEFFDEETFNSKVIEIYTFDGIYTYEPFAVFEALETYHYFEMYFDSDSEFVDFCYEMQDKSMFNKHMDFTADDRIITLSTCKNDPAGLYRYALQAKLVKVER